MMVSRPTAATRESDPAAPPAGAGEYVEVLKRFWGYESLRPLQAEAIRAGVEQRDSLVVMPTGGGKSVCYQIPPIISNRLDVIVSPLIALMKDQVDGLRQCGYPAAAINSSMSMGERNEVEAAAARGQLRLLFVSPEKLMTPRFLDWVDQLGVRTFAIDEAHCISHWGHDFRPEYRELRALKERFTGASLHAFTATATQRVREDIIAQLGLETPNVLIGRFDRPNLVYRVVPRVRAAGQVDDVLQRHKRQAAIVYCITRKESEGMADSLKKLGHRVAAYHAGMTPDERRRVQDGFSAEKIDVVTATVAFGMGIDRSDVRCVIHSAMPKSVEHYQQETGRAGRDGLEAECVLLYSAADAMKWELLITKSVLESGAPPEVMVGYIELLNHMRRYATLAKCRHRMLSEYFGQRYERPECGACDVCLEEQQGLEDASIVAQKILSCVYRVGQSFGAVHIADVLRGADSDGIRRHGHERVSTFGLLKDFDQKTLVSLTFQLLDQGLLTRSMGERPVLSLNQESWRVLRGEQKVSLNIPRTAPVSKTKQEEDAWRDVDAGLFEHLREWRRELAGQRGVPAFVVLGDSTLRHLARVRPSSIDALAAVPGMGERKLKDFGGALLAVLDAFCAQHGLTRDAESEDAASRPQRRPRPLPDNVREMFKAGLTVEGVMQRTGRAESTVWNYLTAYVEQERPKDVARWIPPDRYRRVTDAVREAGSARLKPIFEHLSGEVTYNEIRIVLSHARPGSVAS
ncbi:MAG: DNA helicase RecQ [Phycisphaerales bacterium]|nr:DNA helicase RecQ [Phycisphaerales bacterium]